jgi:hypothetical protein
MQQIHKLITDSIQLSFHPHSNRIHAIRIFTSVPFFPLKYILGKEKTEKKKNNSYSPEIQIKKCSHEDEGFIYGLISFDDSICARIQRKKKMKKIPPFSGRRMKATPKMGN